jgi:hypothetical protein
LNQRPFRKREGSHRHRLVFAKHVPRSTFEVD